MIVCPAFGPAPPRTTIDGLSFFDRYETIFPFPSSPKSHLLRQLKAYTDVVVLIYLIQQQVMVNTYVTNNVVLSEPNYAGNIIINLASLPDFLRKPILKKRMTEFFSMSDSEKSEIINNALEAGPTIPFPNFSKLFKTWLEVLCTVSEENRSMMFANYIKQIVNSPEKIIAFNLDGILEIFLNLESSNQEIISLSIQNLVKNLDDDSKKKLLLLIPENARRVIGF